MTNSRTGVTLIVEDPAWRKSGVDLLRIRTAARLAISLGSEPRDPSRALTILLTNDERLQTLNARFRGRNSATNVLSFPAIKNACGYLGDVAIALGTATHEAATAGISLDAHTLHLAAHGVLHLLGYDHVMAREAQIMERLETAVLRRLGVTSPFALASVAG